MNVTNFVDEAEFKQLGFKTKPYLNLAWVGKGFEEVKGDDGKTQYYKEKRDGKTIERKVNGFKGVAIERLQKESIKYREEGEQVITMNMAGRYGYLWTIIYRKELPLLINKNRNLYEVIGKDIARRIYFDIDGDEADILSRAKTEIKKVFGDDVKMAISGSVGEKKGKMYYSYHIVLPQIYFKNLDEMVNSDFKKWVIEKSDKMEHGIFDGAVYTKNRNMKCLHQTKQKDTRVQEIIEDDVEEHHIIQICNITDDMIDGTTITYPVSEEEQDTKKPKKKKDKKEGVKGSTSKIDMLHITKIKKAPPPRLHIWRSSHKDLLNAIPNLKDNQLGLIIHLSVMGWYKSEGGTWKEFQEWEATYDGEEKEYMNAQKWEDIDVRRVWGRHKIWNLLERFYGKIEDYIITDFKKEFITDKDDCVTLIPSTKLIAGKYLPLDYIRQITEYIPNVSCPIRGDIKYININTQMGSGKTEVAIRYIEALDSEGDRPTVLWITNRQSMANNLMGRLNGLGFKHYKDDCDKKESKTQQRSSWSRIVCELESINTLKTSYDIVIADEVESIFNCFLSKKCFQDEQEVYDDCYMNFEYVLRQAKKVFAMDAFLQHRTPTYFRLLDPKEQQIVIRKENDVIKKVCKGSRNFYEWLKKIVADLKAGKKLYIFYPYKTARGSAYKIPIDMFSAMLQRMAGLDEGDILYYCSGGNQKAKKEQLKNVGKYWSECKAVVTNSSITVGVNYEEKDFDKIYLGYDDMISPRDLIQTSFRIRTTKEAVIEYVEFPNMFKIIANKQKVAYIPPTVSRPTLDGALWEELCMEGDIRPFKHLRDFLIAEFDAKQKDILMYYFTLTGYDVKDIINKKAQTPQEEVEQDPFLSVMAKAKSECESEMKPAYAKVENITSNQMELLKQKVFNNEATGEEQAQVEKFYNKSFWLNRENICDGEEMSWDCPNLRDGMKKIWENDEIMSMIIKYDRLYKERFDIKEIEYEKGFGDPNYHYTLNQAELTTEQKQKIQDYLHLPKKDPRSTKSNIYKKAVLNHFFGKNILDKINSNTGKLSFSDYFHDFLVDIVSNSREHHNYSKEVLEKQMEENLVWCADEEVEFDEDDCNPLDSGVCLIP